MGERGPLTARSFIATFGPIALCIVGTKMLTYIAYETLSLSATHVAKARPAAAAAAAAAAPVAL